MGKLQARIQRGLILYTQQLAWLNAVPKPREGSRRANVEAKAGVKRVSRIETMKPKGAAKDWAPPMPPNPLPHFLDRMIEIGLTEAVGMGVGPTSWRTIADWSHLTGVSLAPWEARLLRRLSVEYLAQSRKAEDENCPPPWRIEVTQSEIDAELDELTAAFG